ncbi:anaerobic ribonucleoside-triphosphate reductase activating protein [Candidatus Micrarchaeota archaeon]|nr:anaerobic ribonucleoside-triphosphate reductase activating protein [Candidatus Micrarchaeota archaeon]
MIIKGVQRTSLIDFPGNICSIVFLAGCSFRCPFCYNKDLVLNSPHIKEIPKESVLRELERRKNYIDGVTITGGEPLLNQDLPEFLSEIKHIGLLVKLDTNGSNPEMLEKSIGENLVDYIAMDIKTSLEKYELATNSKVDFEKIKKSAEIVKNFGKECEFRTTAVPGIVGEKDIEKIGDWLHGSRKYFLQQFKPLTTLDPKYERMKPYNKETLYQFKRIATKYFKKVAVRGI